MIVKDEYISDRVVKSDLLPLSFLRLSPYTGSKRDLRYRIEKIAGEKGDLLRCSFWHGKLSSDNTPDEEKTFSDFEFSEKGIEDIIEYLNRSL